MSTKGSVNGHPPRKRSPLPHRRINVAAIRREQIVDAAAALIAEEGIQNLSLSGIESRTGMSRGQLTYYYREKEQILLAVFDRVVERMRARVDQANGKPKYLTRGDAQAKAGHILDMILNRQASPEFAGLQFTFLAQVRHRDDFRQRLADLYDHWRRELMDDMSPGSRKSLDRRTLASLVQAVFHGLVIQLEADPRAFDRMAMMRACKEVFSLVLPRRAKAAGKTRTRKGP